MSAPEPNAPEGPASAEVWCVVVAAGSGSRFGAPKQFAELGGSRVVDRSVRTASAVCDGVVVVLSAEMLGSPGSDVPGADLVVAGGKTRSDSSRAGVEAVPATASVILVHDAARPLAGEDVFRRVIEAVCAGAPAVVPVVAVSDTLRSRSGGVVDRDSFVGVQTPQGFEAQALRSALAGGTDATDDATLVEAAGWEVGFVDGHPTNRKLTTSDDLVVAEALMVADDLTGGGS